MPDPAHKHIDIADAGATHAPQRAVAPVLFTEPPRPGRNRLVWHGPVTPVEQVAAAVSSATGRAGGALWRMTRGGWQRYAPGEEKQVYVDSPEWLIVELVD